MVNPPFKIVSMRHDFKSILHFDPDTVLGDDRMPKGSKTKEKRVYFSPQEWEIVKKRADAIGETAGRYIREISSGGVVRRFDNIKYKELVNPLRSASCSLMQIENAARKYNSPHLQEIAELVEVQKKLEERFEDHFSEMRHDYETERYWRGRNAEREKHEGFQSLL